MRRTQGHRNRLDDLRVAVYNGLTTIPLDGQRKVGEHLSGVDPLNDPVSRSPGIDLAHKKAWLCIAPVLLFGIDIAFTLAGQPPEYWAGNYHLANETSPPGYWLLAKHPAAFVGAAAVWAGLLSLVVLLLPPTISKIVSLAFVIGHTRGSSSWFERVLGLGYWSLLLFFALASSLVVPTWKGFGDHG
jgi:hypothetical protein